jgi:methylglutaconyl-CoA hydratase
MTSGELLVRTATAAGVTTVTLDSPANRNALSAALIGQLLDALEAAEADDAVRAIVLSHSGTAFCSGADLRETAAAREAGQVPVAMLDRVFAAMVEGRKPVVARVGGPARAGGLGLIAAADIAVCDENATFAFTEVRLGVIPAMISSTVLRRVAPRAAAELYLTGDVFDGRRAAEIGLVSAAVPADRLDDEVAAYCASLVRGAPRALAGTKELLRRAPATTVREDGRQLAELSVGYFLSDEGREGVQAFREKRDPSWVPQG